MEPKVVERVLKQSEEKSLWSFNSKYSYTKQHGSGNNWALGYKLFDQSDYGDEVMEKIRLLLERIDYFGGFLVFQSLAGGTGSGFGTHLVEDIKVNNNKVPLVNITVWPYSTGEVIT
jgi:tubulin delta